MRTSVTSSAMTAVLVGLAETHESFAEQYPGESSARQPVHTVYGGAHLFRAGTAQRLGVKAVAALQAHAPSGDALRLALGFDGESVFETVYERLHEKLQREPVEDFRLDFEDGYGYRPDAEEDACAVSAAAEVAAGLEAGTLPPFIGIRIKSLSAEVAARALRTVDLFVTELVSRTGGVLPDNFVVTLPKVVAPAQVTALVDVFEKLEDALALESGALRMELMVETTQSIFDAHGRAALPSLVSAAGGRCVAAHFGVYDFTAGCSITAQHQHMRHPACDLARQMMLFSLAGTGVWLSDGATNVMPVEVHRRRDGDPELTSAQVDQNRRTVHNAWRLHFEDVQHSMKTGFYQGWDLHPAQLVSRYAAVFSFFLSGLDAASARLRNFVEQASQATLIGEVFDDAATGQGLLNFFLRALNCGAITEQEAQAPGLSIEEIRSRSFVAILDGRNADKC